MKRLLVVVVAACGPDELVIVPDAAPPDAEGASADLTIDEHRAAVDLALHVETFAADACELGADDDCAGGPGARTLLRFTVETPNLGGDLRLGSPVDNPDFVYSDCHMHYHLAGYARYELLDGADVVAAGHKQAFCLEDSRAYEDGAATTARFSCLSQGIQAGWSDVYASDLPCQFIDVTDVPTGAYTLRITLDGDDRIPESDETNNTIDLPVDLGDPDLATPTEACAITDERATSSSARECGWTFDATWTCTPGTHVRAGCACDLGTCTGDPMIRVCDAAEPAGCSNAAQLERFPDQDDACGSLCPRARDVVCPPGGALDIYVASEALGDPFTCPVAVLEN